MAAPATATPQPSSTASGAASLNPASSSAAATAAPSPAARWEPHVTPLAAHVLSQLLLHGPALLAPCLPPPAADLDAQRAADPASPAVEAVESSCSELLRLLPLLTSAARTYPNELPLEEFLFFAPGASGLPPAALLTTYLAYSQPEVAALNPEASLSYQALKALQALQACVARPVSRALLAGLSMGRVVPRGGPAQEALRAMFRCAQCLSATLGGTGLGRMVWGRTSCVEGLYRRCVISRGCVSWLSTCGSQASQGRADMSSASPAKCVTYNRQGWARTRKHPLGFSSVTTCSSALETPISRVAKAFMLIMSDKAASSPVLGSAARAHSATPVSSLTWFVLV